MKKIHLLLIVVIIVLFLIYQREVLNNKTSFFNNEIKVLNVNTNKVSIIDMEEYLIGVLAGEMPASFEIEALKAQAIASRTFAYKKMSNSNKEYDLTTDNSSQVYIEKSKMHELWDEDYNKYYSKIKEAVNSTKNLVMIYDNKLIEAYYFSMSNGYTEDAKTVFGIERPYLKSVQSIDNKLHRNYQKELSFSFEDLSKLLNIDKDIVVNNIIYSDTNHVNKIVLNNKTFSGVEFRKLLNLRSTSFDIEIMNNFVNIITYGNGHGVGMSQYGAQEMAKNHYGYEDILKHYYSGIKIVNIDSIK